MALRQRQHNGTNQHHHAKADETDNKNILLDEDEQETLIQQINDEYIQQSERLEKVFTIICRYIIPIISFIYALILHYRYHDSNDRNSNATKPSHHDKMPDQNLHHHVITLRYIHLFLNFIIHWYIPKGIFRKSTPPSAENTTRTTTTSSEKTSAGEETTVSLILWYGVYLPYFLTLLITAIAHWMIRQQQQQQQSQSKSPLQTSHFVTRTFTEDSLYYNYYHSIFCISATIFLLSAWYIQRDHHEHLCKNINDLKSYKYQYKSL